MSAIFETSRDIVMEKNFFFEKSDARGQRRYKYTCCTLGLTNGP